MKRIERASLRYRLLLWLLLPIGALTALWIWAAYQIALNFVSVAYDRALEDTVKTLADQVKHNEGQIAFKLSPAARQMIEFDPVDKVYYGIADREQRQLAGNHDLSAFSSARARLSPGGVRLYDGRIEGQAVRLAEYRLEPAGTNDVMYVRVAETRRKREILAQELLASMFLPQVVFLLGIAFLVWYGVGRGIAPLNRIRDAIASRSHRDLSPLEETGLPAEVRAQVRVINRLMTQLDEKMDTQRRFIADATHQLRTPITVVRTQAEMAMRIADADELRAALSRLDGATARLVRLSGQLLNLSRADASVHELLDPEEVDVQRLVEDVVARLVPVALQRQIELTVDIADDIPPLHGDRQLLEEMLSNVVDNALRYTATGDTVSVRAAVAGDSVTRLVVSDNGPGIPPAERELVTRRFHRAGESGVEGSGLGLAIVKEIVSLHGGRLSLQANGEDRGLTVVIDLAFPRAPAQAPLP